MKWKGGIIFAISFLFFPVGVSGSEIIWLSKTPPKEISKKIRCGMHGVPFVKDKDGTEKKILWIRAGCIPVQSKYTHRTNTTNPAIFVLGPDGKRIEGELSHGRKGYVFTFEGNLEGFYNVYLVEKFVEGETLNIMIAKAEVLSHKCSNGHVGIQKKMPPKTLKDHIPFEILRERIPREDFHTYLSYGDNVAFKVFLDGAPVEGSNLMLSTQKRWINNLESGKDGEAVFQLIGDYYSEWKELNKRKIHNFLLMAEHTVTGSGGHDGKPYKQINYIGTLAGTYIPSKTLYTSYVYALLLLTFVITITTIFVYFHRGRRKKPYKENVFCEKN